MNPGTGKVTHKDGLRAAELIAEDIRQNLDVTVLSIDLFEYIRRRWHILSPLAHTIEKAPEKDMIAGTDMSFSDALKHVRLGFRATRRGWNGKGMFIFLVPGSTFKVNREPLLSILGEGTEVNYHGHVDMKTATGQIVPWLCSQTDMLADDWLLL